MRGQCDYPTCPSPAQYQCDNCAANFCEDHGSKGGDQSYGEGIMAYPSVCWKCGGFNVDE